MRYVIFSDKSPKNEMIFPRGEYISDYVFDGLDSSQKNHSLLDKILGFEVEYSNVYLWMKPEDQHPWIMEYIKGNGVEVFDMEAAKKEPASETLPDAPSMPDDEVFYKKLKWNDLRAYAKEKGIKTTGMKKAEIIEALDALN